MMLGVEKDGISVMFTNVNVSYYTIGKMCSHMGYNYSDGPLNGETINGHVLAQVFK